MSERSAFTTVTSGSGCQSSWNTWRAGQAWRPDLGVRVALLTSSELPIGVLDNRQLTEQSGLMSDELTEAELDAILARAENSLDGPWQSFVEGRDHFGGDNFIRAGGLDDETPDMYVTLSCWNTEPPKAATPAILDFIAAARQDVPRLVAEVRRLRALSA